MNECKAALADTPTLRKIVPALLPLLWLLLLYSHEASSLVRRG